MRLLRPLSLALLLVAGPVAAHAQKKVLTQADWDRWRSIQGATLSADGKWVAYTLSPQVGDGEFVVRSTSGSTEYRIPVGYISRPNNTPGGLRAAAAPAGGGGRGGRGGGGGAGGTGPFTSDAKYALVTTQPTKDEVERAQKAAAAARGARGAGAAGGGAAAPAAANDTANQNALVIVTLADGRTTMIKGARGFRVPRDNGNWLVYGAPPDSATADSAGRGAQPAGGGAPAGGGRGGRGGGGRGGANGAPAGGRRAYGSTVVLRNMTTGSEEKITDVLAYTFDDSAKVLAYTVVSRDSTKDGVFVRNMATGAVQTVMTGRGNYRNFTFDRVQQQFVFTSDHDEFGRPNAHSTLYYGTLKNGTAQPIVSTSALPRDMHVADNGSVSFTRNGNAVVLSIAPPPDDTVPADSLVGKSTYDLWNYKDPTLQPQQKLQVNRDRNRTYEAVYDLASKRLVRLTDDSMPSATLSDDGKVGIASTGVAYDIERMWGDGGNDVYLVDATTGNRKLIHKKISGNAQLSVDAKDAIYFDEGHYYTYNIATGKTTDITGPVKGVHFEQETWSTPDTPAPWPVAGWTKGDKSVLIYDRFDLWEIDPNGVKPAVVVTDSVGRKESLQFRLVAPFERDDDRAIDPAKPLLFRVFSEATKGSGFYRDRLDAKQLPEKIIFGDLNYGPPQKAQHAEEYMLTKSTFVDFPNLWVGPSIAQANTKLTDANPWQKEYNWGTAELVTWTSADGVPLQGILYKPENFDPKKKYPMVSYFYEELSDGLYNYIAPNGRNVINPTHYVSNGYLIFEPDIHYEIGYPGPSAVKSIVPGVQKLLERGYVDPKGLGLQGQSWGGYQTAFMITQTTMFSAAMAGAPVANMTSAYGGIRWGSGLARAFQYEKTQSRIGKSIWEAQNLYIENSPLFWLPRVTTPLFIMSNDMDDAVPWYQGIEMFVGMRRLGKEVYLVDYNNDVHNPSSRANQKDVALKMQQFFDNKLMGKPAPDWMTKGIPAKDKGKDQVPVPIRP